MNASPLPGLQFVVLAAGFSARLGSSKALARVRGVSLLRNTIRSLAGVTKSKIIVVSPPRCSRYRVELRRHAVHWAINHRRAEGLSSSVRCAIKTAWCSTAILFLPVDLVRVEARDIGRLIARWRGARRHVVARRVDAKAGTPLILPRWLYGRALEIAGDRGLRDAIRHVRRDLVTLIDLPAAACDVDTGPDLEAARRFRPDRFAP